MEIVSQRILWSLVLILTILMVRGNIPALLAVLSRPHLALPLTASAILICSNWLLYVWTVNNNHVIAASFAYFLGPLINVAFGVLILKERLRRTQLLAIGTAATGVMIMAGTALTTLWISVALALTFALYGLIRKLTPVAPMVGLGAETLLLLPFAVAYMGWLAHHGGLNIGKDGVTTLLLIAAGAVTTIPLVLFAMAAQKLPMATLGLLQYIAPTLLFLCGVLLYGEVLSQGQILSFALIWAGLILFAADSIAAARRNDVAA